VNLYWPEHFFRSEAARGRRRLARWRRAEKAAEKVLLLSHANCLDGIGAAVVTLRSLQGVAVAYVQPNDMAEALAFVTKSPSRGRRVMIADRSLQREQFDAIVDACGRLKAAGWSIEWRDHHHKQWEGLDLSRLRRHLEVLEVNDDATESGASLQQQALAPRDPFLKRLAETVRDRDLWWNKTPDSETLEFALSNMGPADFQRHLLGMDGEVVDAALRAAAQREREAQARVLNRLLDEARYYGEGRTRVGVIYGWLPKNTGLHELLADRGCQVAVNVRPNGKMSLRSRKEAPVCHLIAQRFAGGGHPNASGGDLGLKGLRYWVYVIRRGRVPAVEQVAKAAVETLGAS
jgi:oligoribonuclease NrnB/cAMP/cGMP phosphodiesterase (DHH superfamily)